MFSKQFHQALREIEIWKPTIETLTWRSSPGDNNMQDMSNDSDSSDKLGRSLLWSNARQAKIKEVAVVSLPHSSSTSKKTNETQTQVMTFDSIFIKSW